MKFRNMYLKYGAMNAAGSDGADGGSGAGKQDDAPPAEKTYTQADVDKLVAGLKSKNGEVIGDNKKLKEQLARFEGIDPDAVRTILQNFADRDGGKTLIDTGKMLASLSCAYGKDWAEAGYPQGDVPRWLHFGVPQNHLPARGHLGLSDGDKAAVLGMMADYFERLLT